MSTPRRNSKTASRQQTQKATPATRRRVAVLVSLVAVLTFTSALLLALAPPPLNPQASSSLFASDATDSLDMVFDGTTVPLEAGRWHYIFIHHSGSLSGSAKTMADSADGLPDHFVIGNGDGCADGELQLCQRWTQQLLPGRSPNGEADCISICLIGDFNQSRPTVAQERHLEQLVSALQDRLHIPRSRVQFSQQPDRAAGIGRYFPASEFRSRILP